MNKFVATMTIAVATTIPALVTNVGSAVAGKQVGTSCADCPSYKGAFSIENATGVTISYQVKWGSSQAWKNISLQSGHIETHSYPLGENRNGTAPTPYVRYDRIGGDARYTGQEYRMLFHAVGYAGYGPARNTTEPKRYYFQYAADRKTLELLAR